MDKTLYSGLIQELLQECGGDVYEDPLCLIDDSLNIENLKAKDIIGKMWAIVIDYHT